MPQETIQLFINGSHWFAKFSDPMVKVLFDTDEIVTPFRATVPADTVLNYIADKNPDYTVSLRA